MSINTLQDLLKHHQTALGRHQAHYAKRPEQYPRLPGLVRTKQQADQYKIDFHQQCIEVIQRTQHDLERLSGGTKPV